MKKKSLFNKFVILQIILSFLFGSHTFAQIGSGQSKQGSITKKNVNNSINKKYPTVCNSSILPTITNKKFLLNAKKYSQPNKSSIILNFEGIVNLAPISNYYNGGGGANYGIYFSSNTLALINSTSGGSGNTGNLPSGITSMFFLDGVATMNIPSGFTNGFSFYYASSQIGTVYVYDGVEGTGNLLASQTFNPTLNPWYNWVAMGVSFTGTAKSVTFSGVANQCTFDDVTFGSVIPGGNGPTNPTDPTSISATNTTICNGISTQLTANGAEGTVYWYTSSCGGTQFTTGNPITVNPAVSTTYYAKNYNNSAYSNGCASVTITVNNNFTSGAISTTGQTICYNTAPTVTIGNATDAVGGDNNISYTWRSSADNYTTAISGATSSTYLPTAALTATTSYRRYAKDNTCNTTPEVSAGTWTVSVRPAFTSGTIANTGETICYNGDPSLIGSTTDASGGNTVITYQWQSSTDAAFTSPTTISSNTATYDPPTGLTVTTWYRRQAKDGVCNTSWNNSAAVWKVTVRPAFTAGSISTTGETICYNTSPTLTVGSSADAEGGDNTISYTWRSSTDNYATAISGATSSTYLPTAALTTTTSYRRYAKDNTCNTTPEVSSGTWTVSVRPAFTSGAIATTGETICYNENPSLIGSTTDASGGDNSITYKWQANGTDIPSSDAATYDPPAGLTATTTYTRYAKDGTCNNFTLSGGSWIVTIDPPSVGGTISGTTTITYGSSTGTMTLGSYIGTIQKWQKKLGTGSWIDISNTNATYSETPTGAGTWYYKAFVKSGTCSETTSAEFAVTVEKKALSITANNKVKTYDGLIYSPFTVSYNGFVLSDSYLSLGGSLSFSGTATTATEVGTYIITPGGFTSTNYIISYSNGSLTINCSPLVNVFNNNNSGYGSLRNAMANLCSNGTITFNSINNQTINLTSGTLAVDKNITFNNSNHTNGITIAGGGTNLTINSGKVLTLASNSKITVSGAIVNNGGTAGLVIESGASFIHNTVDLQATTKRYLNNGWHLIGSPFKKTLYTISNIAPAGGIQIKPYTNGTNWQLNVSSMYTYLLPTTGYAVKPTANYTMTLVGNLYYSNISFDNTVALTYNGTSATQSWNLLANPYTSNIDFKTLTKTNISQSLYIWDNTRYPNIAPVTNTTYFNTFNTLTNVGVPVGTTSIIAPMQGFFVKATYTTPKIVFTPASRTHSSAVFYKNYDTEILLRLKAESEQGADELAICKNEAAKQSFEEYDSEKLLNGNPIEIYSYARTGEKLTINTANANKEIIPLGINAEAGSKVKISSFGMESAENLYLEDRIKGKLISLSENTEYTFVADEKSEYGRFFIRFGNTNSGLTSSDISVTQNGSELSIIAQTGESIEQIEIFTITGARVYSAMESTNVHTVNLNLSKAMYLIRVKTSIETQNLKFNWK